MNIIYDFDTTNDGRFLSLESLLDKSKLANVLQLNEKLIGTMTLEAIIARMKTIQMLSPDDVPLETKILWAGEYYTSLCSVFNKELVDKYLNLVPFTLMSSYVKLSSKHREIVPPTVGTFIRKETFSQIVSKNRNPVVYTEETWSVPTQLYYKNWLFSQCILEAYPNLKPFKFDCYPENNNLENTELYFNLGNKHIHLYVPIKAIQNHDFSIVVDRMNSYWDSYGKLGGKADTLAKCAIAEMKEELVNKIKNAIISK